MAIRKKCIGLLAAALLCFTAASANAEPLLYGSFSIFSFFRPVDGATGALNPGDGDFGAFDTDKPPFFTDLDDLELADVNGDGALDLAYQSSRPRGVRSSTL